VHAQQIEYDRMRDAFITTHGVTILRFTNDEVLNDLDSVLWRIETVIDMASTPERASAERTD
jgi:very-short-patch-repair endonuclease